MNEKNEEKKLVLPAWLKELEDQIFNGLPNHESEDFREQFLKALPVGADLSLVLYQFLHWLLVDDACGVIRFASTEKSKKLILVVADLFSKKINGQEISEADWRAAADAARASYSREAAYAYTRDFVYAYPYAAVATAAYAADAARAYAATTIAHIVALAAVYATFAYANAAFDAAAYIAAQQQARRDQRNKLLELLRAAPKIKDKEMKDPISALEARVSALERLLERSTR